MIELDGLKAEAECRDSHNLFPIRHPMIEKILQDFIDKSNGTKAEGQAADGEATSLRDK